MAPSPPPDTSAQSADTDQDGLPLAQVAQTQIKSYVVHKQHELSGMIKGEESKTETELHMHIQACLDAINYLGPSVEVGKNFKAGILQHFPDDEDLGHLVYRKVMQGVKGRSPHWDIIGSKLREIVDILNDGYGDSGGESQQVGQLGASSESPGELPTPVSPIFSAQCKPPSSGRKRPPPLEDLFKDDDRDPSTTLDSQISKRPRADTAPATSRPEKTVAAGVHQRSSLPASESQKGRPMPPPTSTSSAKKKIDCRAQKLSNTGARARSTSPAGAASSTRGSPTKRGDRISMKRTAWPKLPGKVPIIRAPKKPTQEKPPDQRSSGF
ncbi:hypothetical protein MCOR34_005918 [Pyricularia oryzae]|nr:hypothetical protein MCOR34_005918 [Pyricularia oryzae]KAI6579707.1 hypothetical protein MCOR04_005960 [Pyricularia oryzae]